MPKRQTITGTCYSNLRDKFQVALKNKRRGMLSRGSRFLADNAKAHLSQVAVDKARTCGFEILQHPPYSLDLAPVVFFLVLGMLPRVIIFLADKAKACESGVLQYSPYSPQYAPSDFLLFPK